MVKMGPNLHLDLETVVFCVVFFPSTKTQNHFDS